MLIRPLSLSEPTDFSEIAYVLIAATAVPAGFDAAYYLSHNPDVAAAKVDPLQHFQSIGWREGRDPSAGFSVSQYLANNPDVRAAGVEPLSHYNAAGKAEGRLARYDQGFDRIYYLANNPDVAAAGVDPLQHYLTFGWKEGRDPSALFNTRFYLAQNPDVAATGINPLLHFITRGWTEGRDPSAGFSVSQYLLNNPDVKAAGIDPLLHYITNGQAEGRLPRYDVDFDRAYYLAQNPDVAAAKVDPLQHFLTLGWHEGRNPNALFDTKYYLANNPDVAAAGIDPLLQYTTIGWKEGRNPSALFNTRAYLAEYPDVAATHTDPLQHYLTYGRNEGRDTGTTPGHAPSASLAVAYRTTSDHATGAPVVELTGQADPGVTVHLTGTTLTAVADASGLFRLAGVQLAAGHNTVELTAIDTQGRLGRVSVGLDRTADPAGTVVTDWDQLLLDSLPAQGTDPQVASRAMAIEGVAVVDALNALQGKAGFLVRLAAPAGIAAAPAIAAAAHDVLVYLFPTRAAIFDAALARVVAAEPAGALTDQAVTFGRAVAAAVIAIRDRDGWNKITPFDGSADPGKWRPTAPDFGLAQDPQWATVTPFTLTSDSEFRPAGPPALTSDAYKQGVALVQSIGSLTSTTRTADQTAIAKYWSDGAGTVTPPGHWNAIARQVVASLGLDTATSARVLAEVDVALADSAFADFNAKYFYDAARPITIIRDGVVGTADPTWTPLLKTPPHPSYVSGHSTYSAAAATVLDSLFGTVGFSSTNSSGVTRSFASFDGAAQEAAISRLYAGIHYTWDSADGATLGTYVGSNVVTTFEGGRNNGPVLLLDQQGTASTSGTLTLSGYALDDTAPLTQIIATLDGGAAKTVVVDAAGRFTLSTDTLFGTVAAGAHQIALQAQDAGQKVTSITAPYTRGSGGISLSLASPGTNGALTAASRLVGTVSSTAAAVTGLTYQFDAGVVTPVLFTGTGAFDTALDLSKLAAGSHTLTVRASDASGGVSVVTATETLAALVPLTIVSLTPVNDAGDIGVTYRPEVVFSRAVDPTTLTASSLYATDASGAPVAATIVPRADGTGASLFFTNPLPGAATITLHLVGSLIRGTDGAQLDAAGTGAPGSTATSRLVTVSTASIATTVLTGIVADPGADLQPGGADDVRNNPDGTKTYLKPIAHAKVYVLGQESQAVYTDSLGSFTLTGVPSGTVKVAIDGRTATNAPTGVFFPEMVLDTQVQAGVVNTLPGGMGTAEEMAAHKTTLGVYLPRVQADILTPLSTTAQTVVTVPADAAGLLSDAQRSQLSLTVAPGSLVGMDGKPIAGATVGISPVPADLVKDMLPAGLLQHTFDITIQAPGGAAFTTPATLTLPNVFGLAPGEKTYVLSFDHTTGRLVIDGTATASADGLTITTDPGQGVTKPGWHGVTPPGSSSSGPNSATDPKPDMPCDKKKVAGAFKDTLPVLIKDGLDCLGKVYQQVATIKALLKDFADITANTIQIVNNVAALKQAQAQGDSQAALVARANVLEYTCSNIAALYNVALAAAKTETAEITTSIVCLNAILDAGTYIVSNANSAGCLSPLSYTLLYSGLNTASFLTKELVNLQNLLNGNLSVGQLNTVCDAVNFLVNQFGVVTQDTAASDGSGIVLASANDSVSDLAAAFAAVTTQLSSFQGGLTGATGALGSLSTTISNSTLDTTLPALLANVERVINGAPADVYYEVTVGGQVYRGVTGASGKLDFFFPPSSQYTIKYYDAALDLYAVTTGTSATSGATTTLPNPLFLPIAGLPITGPGGLPDLVEGIVGGSVTRADSLVPGVMDVVAVHQGVAATRSLLNTTGVIASAALQGSATQVVIAGSLTDPAGAYAYVATGLYGLAILDVSNPLKPGLLSETKLTGDATGVAVDSTLGIAAVADGAGGLVLLDLKSLTAPTVITTVAGSVRAVQTFEGVAYCTDDNSLVAIDLATGAVLQRLPLSENGLLGLTRDGSTLWVRDNAGILTGVSIATGVMVRTGSAPISSFGNSNLFAAAGIVYAGSTVAGYTTVDVRVPATPVVLAGASRTGTVGAAVVLNGTGQGVAIGTVTIGTNVLDFADTRDPTNTSALLTEFTLPGAPNGIAIGAGVAYVADGTSGLQVVNYKAIDTSGVGPTITILSGPGSTPGATAATLSEGSVAGFTIQLTDPGQIRNVELLLNGKAVVNDNSYPFELSAFLPSIAAAGTTVTLAIRATDTAGHVTTTAPLVVTLTPDRTQPTLLDLSLVGGSTHSAKFRSITYRFSKPIDPAALTPGSFSLTGPGNGVVAPLSYQSRAGGRQIVVTYPVLQAGNYTVTLNAAQILDLAGNALAGTPASTAFTIAAGNYTTAWSSPISGFWPVPDNWDGLQVPGAADTVLLALPGTVTVTHDRGTDVVAGVTLTGGTLSLTGGTLEVNGAVDVQGGVLTLGGGTLRHAVLKQNGGKITYGTVILDGVTFANALAVDGGYISMANAQPYTAATLDLRSGNNGVTSLSYLGSQSFDNVAIHLGGTSAGIFGSYADTITLGSGVVLDGSGSVSALVGNISNAGQIKGSVTLFGRDTVNTGRIDLTLLSGAASPATLLLSSLSLANSGTITGAGKFLVLGAGGLINTGTIKLSDGAGLSLSGTITNTGTIDLGSGALSIQYQTVVTPGLLKSIVATGSALTVSGTLDLTGTTLNQTTLPQFGSIGTANGGTIKGGTIQQGSYLTLGNGTTFDGVTWSGGLSLVGGSYSIRNGFVVQGGPVDLRNSPQMYGARLNFLGNQTVSGVSFISGAGATPSTNGFSAGEGSVILAADTTLSVQGGTTEISSSGGTIAPDGRIIPNSVINQGTISVASGARLQVNKNRLSGANVNAQPASTGTIALAPGATLEIDNATALSDLASFGTTIGSGGTLSLGFGTLDLAGGTLDSATVLPGTSVVELNGVTLTNGALQGTFTSASGHLSGVAVNGTLTLSGRLDADTLTTQGLVLNFAGSSDDISFTKAQVLDHTAIHMLAVPGVPVTSISKYLIDNTLLTLGATSSMDIQAGSGGSIIAPFINAGTITTASAGVHFLGTGFTNQGTLTETAGDVLISGGSVTNTGTVSVSAGAKLEIYSNDISNTGSIAVAAGAKLQVDQDTSLARLGNTGGGGALLLGGKLDLSGGTLDLNAPGGFGSVGLTKAGSAISNGTIHEGRSVISIAGGTTLTNVAITTQGGTVVSTAALADTGAARNNTDGSITLGPDGSTVHFMGANAVVSSAGRAFIFGAGDHDTIALTNGHIGQADIYGFSQTNGDVLDVSAALAGTNWDHTAGTLSLYLAAAATGTGGADTTVYFGSGNGYVGGYTAVLHNQTGSIASLQAAGALKLL